jgi:fatty-acyl-CoA synthase
MPPALETQIRQSFKPAGIVSFYGITEMVCVSARRTTVDGAYDGSVGYPAPNVQVMIYDDVRGPLPCGEIGEIFIRGPVAFSHYVGNTEATTRATARVEGVEWYRSGDIGMLDSEGCLSILDRRKDMILSGGENIYSAEVETAILRHPGVAEVAVVGRPEEKWGEIVVAFVVARGSEDLSLESIRTACHGLASYKHPKELFVVESLPRNSFGKVQKAILKQGFPAQRD